MLIIGDSKVELPKLATKIGAINIFHHDSKHTYEHMSFEFKTIWQSLVVNGILASDDVNWNSAFQDFRSRHMTKANIVEGIGFTTKK